MSDAKRVFFGTLIFLGSVGGAWALEKSFGLPTGESAGKAAAINEVPSAASAEGSTADIGDEPVHSDLPIDLVGTIVRSPDSESMATIHYSTETNAENVFPQTNLRQLALVTRIERERLIFRNLQSQQIEYVRIGPFDPKKRATPQALDDLSNQDKEFHIPRTFVDQVTSDLPGFLQQAQAVPQLAADGTVSGFQINAIVPGSAYEKLGLKNGDVIKAVNGHPITGVQDALQLYAQLRESSMVQLKMTRGGREVNSTYLIR